MNAESVQSEPRFQLEAARTLLFLVRHGQTTWNVERRFQGQLDVPLSVEGYKQAEAAADWLSALDIPFSAIYTSDLRRAVDTAKTIASYQGMVPLQVEALRELNAGEWQGLDTQEVEALYPGQLREWREHVATFTLPRGECIYDVQQRVFKYVSDACERHKGQAIIVVSHGAALSSLIAALNGWDLQATWDTRRARMSNTGITVLSVGTVETTKVLLLNSTAHLTLPADLPSVIDPEPGVDKVEKEVAAEEFAV